MTEHRTLPLFPLPLAILPGEIAALHLFEPRYLDMFAACEQDPRTDGDFVIAFAGDSQTDPVGCAVTISRVLHRNPDGTVDLLVEGRRRVRIHSRHQLHSYDSVRVEERDEETDDWDDALATRVYALHRQVLVAATGDEPPDTFYSRRHSLAYAVAACAGFTPQAKRELLALDHENQRLTVVLHQLEDILPLLRRALPLWKDILGAYTLAILPEADNSP